VPEGDTVFLAATRLRAALAGQVLTRTDFRVPRFATVDLAGRTVQDVVSRGKHLLFRIGGGVTLHTHFKMEGSWHLYRPGERWRGPGWRVRVLLETAPWIALGFRLAVAELIETAREREVLGHLGPDPLGEGWDAAEALRRLLAHPDRPIGDALLDQRVMAGPGNVWKNELCFLRGLDPETPVGRVPQPEHLVALVRELFEGSKTTGSQLTTGDPRPGRRHWVYGRSGQPCRRCGTPIRVRGTREAGRATYWCPSCQPVSLP
jgi:formamidopyrimidine-DNA glycosylase